MPVNNNLPPSTDKPYVITNITTYAALVLDIASHNYDPLCNLFTIRCITQDAVDHTESSYDAPFTPLMIFEWEKLDSMVKLWLFASIYQSIITSTYNLNALARKFWLNINALYCENSIDLQPKSELKSISVRTSRFVFIAKKSKRSSIYLKDLVKPFIS